MIVGLKMSSGAKAALEKSISRKVAELAAKAATEVYNTAISYQVRWSGTYRASFQILYEGDTPYHLQHPTKRSGKPDIVYPAPGKYTMVLPNYSNPFSRLTVTNTADHVKVVEYEGTPTHAGGWMVMHHAKTQALAKFRLF